jgi:hypothetical protein
MSRVQEPNDEGIKQMEMHQSRVSSHKNTGRERIMGTGAAVIEKKPETKTEPQKQGIPPKPPVKKIKPGEEKHGLGR